MTAFARTRNRQGGKGMDRPMKRWTLALLGIAVSALLWNPTATAAIDGVKGDTFFLDATTGFIDTGEGNRVLFWGFADGQTGLVQYPGPTLIVTEGQPVSVTLRNWLPEPVSLVFGGQDNVVAPAGQRGLIAAEARTGGGTVTYHFTPARPGTYYYHTGTNMDKQLVMGLFGALIVRPAGYDAADNTTWRAYNDNASRYTREFLFLVSEMDDRFNTEVETGQPVDTTTFFPVYWFVNGRNAPDTMSPDRVSYLPTQPYGAMAMMHPGDNVLVRLINMGHDPHPFHTHGNHVRIIARDGRLRSTNEGVAGADLSELAFSVTTAPGRTVDAIFQWTGKDLGWDIYGDPAVNGHTCIDNNLDGYDDTTVEWCADHGKPFPVFLPNLEDLDFGPFWSGSPFMGETGVLPVGVTRFNFNGGYFMMWHSHNEKELTNNDVFPGGLMTFMDVEPPWIDIPEVP